jgi:hypothetical protein
MNEISTANNSAKKLLDDSFRGQLSSGSVFNMSQLDIPSYYQENTSVGNSTHTTPLNYMRRSTPAAASQNARRVEQIRERDTFSGLEEEQDRDIDVKFDMMKLSSNVTDDFFQLQSKNDSELEALEPSKDEFGRQGQSSELFHPSGNNDLSRRIDPRSDDSTGTADQVIATICSPSHIPFVYLTYSMSTVLQGQRLRQLRLRIRPGRRRKLPPGLSLPQPPRGVAVPGPVQPAGWRPVLRVLQQLPGRAALQ